jgi:hypothetical protein
MSLSDDEENLGPTRQRPKRGYSYYTNIRGEFERHVFPTIVAKINRENPKKIETPATVFQRIKRVENHATGNGSRTFIDNIQFILGPNDRYDNIKRNDILLLNDGHAVYIGDQVHVVKDPNDYSSGAVFNASYSPFPKGQNTDNIRPELYKKFYVFGSEIIGVVKPSDGKTYENWNHIISLYRTLAGGKKPAKK